MRSVERSARVSSVDIFYGHELITSDFTPSELACELVFTSPIDRHLQAIRGLREGREKLLSLNHLFLIHLI